MSFENRLFIPQFSTERMFPSVGGLELKLFFNSSEFCLMSSRDEPIPDVILQIERLDLKYRRVQLSEQAASNVTEMMRRERRLLYNIIEYDHQNYQLYKGTRYRTTPDATLSVWPRRMFVMFVNTKNFAG